MRVLHVVATGQRRGAEVFAADLVGALDEDGVEQRVAVLHGGDLAVRYVAPTTVLGADGRGLPGTRMGLPGVRALRHSRPLPDRAGKNAWKHGRAAPRAPQGWASDSRSGPLTFPRDMTQNS